MRVDEIISRVQKPGRYCGNEFNVVRKEWESARVRAVLAFPDLYEIGMSHQGLLILYHQLNSRDGFLAERVYAPGIDMEQELKSSGQPLFSLESRRPLREFDFIGITLPYELCSSNILTLLDLSGLALRSAERVDGDPLVIGGGPGAFNPEPVAEFFDGILLGDGEEAIVEIAELAARVRKERIPREEAFSMLAQIEGMYVPNLYTPRYDRDGRFLGMEAPPNREKVKRRFVPDLDRVAVDLPPLVPSTRIVHDRLGIEIARGCTRGCRFCQAGIIYRPVRERSAERVFEEALAKIGQTGFEELALLSLSTGDYACLEPLLARLMERLSPRKVSVSMPSMRVGTLSSGIMEQIRKVRKTGFTVAPEAGSERLRQVINKGITEKDLLDTAKNAFALGWQLIKLYFMVGLPTETLEDVAEIAKLARKVAVQGGARNRVTVSCAVFVPKPHTPFERVRQLGIEEGWERIDLLKREIGDRRIKIKWHDPSQSFLEGVLSRGDRRLSRVIEAAWRDGARFDGWSDHLDLGRWQRAAAACGVDLAGYLEERGGEDPLPWEHLDTGVERAFLRREYEKGLSGGYTPDCRVHGCQQCGVCDFKRVSPMVHRQISSPLSASEGDEEGLAASPGIFRYRLVYSRLGEARFLSHLELLQVFFRALRRVRFPVRYSQGFNPSPKVSFGPALPVGTESLDEYLLVETQGLLKKPAAWIEKLNRALPTGLEVRNLFLDTGEVSSEHLVCYHLTLEHPPSKNIIDTLLNDPQWSITVRRKGKPVKRAVRRHLVSLDLAPSGVIELILRVKTGEPSLKPLEIIGAIPGMDDEALARARVLKVWSRPVEEDCAGTKREEEQKRWQRNS